jgi:hypothetical protein
MRFQSIGSNMAEITTNHGQGLNSYSTLVAVKTAAGVFVHERKFSATTQRHIGKWLAAMGLDKKDARTVSGAELAKLLGLGEML